jgi:hypothetical protein
MKRRKALLIILVCEPTSQESFGKFLRRRFTNDEERTRGCVWVGYLPSSRKKSGHYYADPTELISHFRIKSTQRPTSGRHISIFTQKDTQPSQTCSGGFIKTQLEAIGCCFFAIRSIILKWGLPTTHHQKVRFQNYFMNGFRIRGG